MAKRKKAAEVTSPEIDTPSAPDASFNPAEFDPAYQQQAAAVVQDAADSRIEPEPPANGFTAQHAPANGRVANVSKKAFPQAPNPFGVENILGDGNRVRLLKEEPNRERGFPGAWVIRFEKNPNEMTAPEGVPYGKERPHPVLKMLKDEGYRWGFSGGDEKGGWGKLMQEGHYTYAEHMDARKVLAKAAEMIGAKVEQGYIPD